jgi:cytosolic carboxypeptidase protein 2/3
VRFNISNYYKADSMFNYGMKVTVYSEKKAKEQGVGWHRDGSNIRYYQNTVRKDYSYTNYFYSLSWDYEFEFDEDAVYFSYSFPYTYSDLRRDLAAIENDEVKSQYVMVSTLCKTLSIIDCPMLTITNRNGRTDKKCVVLTARQHPGETVGSFMMLGAIKFLTDPDSQEAH